MKKSFYHARGKLVRRLEPLIDRWLIPMPEANPQILEMFGPQRNALPIRPGSRWCGEFAGKYLTAATWIQKLHPTERLYAHLEHFVRLLLKRQSASGYLGVFPERDEYNNVAFTEIPNAAEWPVWDTWSLYHVMYGLIQWYELSHDKSALDGAEKIAAGIIRHYSPEHLPRLGGSGFPFTNQAPVHAVLLLYRLTGKAVYLEAGKRWVEEFSQPGAGDFLNAPLRGVPMYQMELPRWESLHPVMALAEMYRITGESSYLTSLENLWQGILKNDVHNNGGFSSGEKANGNPYDPDAIETCCTIAFMELSVQLWHLNHKPEIIDYLELATCNSVLGMHSPSGVWATYDTPSDGVRSASFHYIVFQARPGSPQLNCCSVNSPKGYGLLASWGAAAGEDGVIYLNNFTAAEFDDGSGWKLESDSDYPSTPDWKSVIRVDAPCTRNLMIRIPAWSKQTEIRLNGHAVPCTAGTYCSLHREWHDGDTLEIGFDFSLHVLHGERDMSERISIYRGPVLLACDQRFNFHLPQVQPKTDQQVPTDYPSPRYSGEYLHLPEIPETFHLEPAPDSVYPDWLLPDQLYQVHAKNGEVLYLCDFASAGITGSLYRSWLPAEKDRI